MHIVRNPETHRVRSIHMPESEYLQLQADHGICLGCDNIQSRVEPDARRVTCESCGKPFVYGVAQLLLMGRLEFTAAATEEEAQVG